MTEGLKYKFIIQLKNFKYIWIILFVGIFLGSLNMVDSASYFGGAAFFCARDDSGLWHFWRGERLRAVFKVALYWAAPIFVIYSQAVADCITVMLRSAFSFRSTVIAYTFDGIRVGRLAFIGGLLFFGVNCFVYWTGFDKPPFGLVIGFRNAFFDTDFIFAVQTDFRKWFWRLASGSVYLHYRSVVGFRIFFSDKNHLRKS